MKNVIYRKFICSDAEGWDKTFVTLTEEVNRLIVWNEGYIGEEMELMVIKTFPDFQRNEAIEFAVKCAEEAIVDAKIRPAPPPPTRRISGLTPGGSCRR